MFTEDQILRMMRERVDHPATPKELQQLLRVPREERATFRRRLRALVSSGALVEIRGHRFGLPDRMNLIVGRVSTNPRSRIPSWRRASSASEVNATGVSSMACGSRGADKSGGRTCCDCCGDVVAPARCEPRRGRRRKPCRLSLDSVVLEFKLVFVASGPGR